MHFLLLGASGRTGKHVVSQLLAQGHTATALVRKASSLNPQTGLTIATGTPLSKDDIKAAVAASSTPISAAIVTLNAPRKSDSPFAPTISPPRLMADSVANACEVLSAAGVRRIVIMSTAGAGDSWSQLPTVSKMFMGWSNVKLALKDHNIVDKEIRATNMDFTLVRAVRLVFDDPNKPKEPTDLRALDSAGHGQSMMDGVRDANVARFMIKAAVEGLYIKEAVVVRD